MLTQLYVKDMALIDSCGLEFEEGLNILTGETGAGKSILIGSINLALGGKGSKDMIRSGKEYGMVELVFSELTEKQTEKLRAMEVEPEDGQLIIRRRISEKRSEIRINDSISTLSRLREVTELLIDIHGQHEHQSLLREGAHLRILDEFSGEETGELRKRTREAYQTFKTLESRFLAFDMDEEQRKRELDFLSFEIREIEEAELREGEEEELSARYRKYQHARRISSALMQTRELLSEAELSRAVGMAESVLPYDEELKGITDSLYDLQSVSEDILRELDRYLDRNEYDEEALRRTESRLDEIRSVMMKYGGSVEKTEQRLQEKKERLAELENYESRKKECGLALERAEKELGELCGRLSEARREAAKRLCKRISLEMEEMGFLSVRLELELSALPHPTANGQDDVRFLVSLNPGEPLRPLSEVASGGELSRIMLSIKTVLADTDEIPTLIFDEIDTGISGRTAEKVSEKLKKIARNHQVILITHLPQIAAKADVHFGIEKKLSEGRSRTEIGKLTEEESVLELARLLSGETLTEAVLANARELKCLAREIKKE